VKAENAFKNLEDSLQLEFDAERQQAIANMAAGATCKNFSLYPDVCGKNKFSFEEVRKELGQIKRNECAAYHVFMESKLGYSHRLGIQRNLEIGFVYAIKNYSMPGVLKIGCTSDIDIRCKELTTGDNYRNTRSYRYAHNNENLYTVSQYTKDINMRLKTSLPSPFYPVVYAKSYYMYEAECLIHFLLRYLNVRRNAGTEFFVMTEDEVKRVFGLMFAKRIIDKPVSLS